MSILKKYHGDGDNIIKWDTILLGKDLQYEEEPVEIMDRDVRNMKTKHIKCVKVQWKYHQIEEATWKIKKDV